MAQTEDNLKFLRSLKQVRQFLPAPVPDEVVDDILRALRWTGTASNRQDWEVVVIRDRATLQALGDIGRPSGHLAGATVGIVIVMAGEEGREELEIYDEGRLSERIMLAAHAHGVGSGIGWLIGDKAPEVKKLLNIPDQRRVRTAISLGYPDEEARRQRPANPLPRKPLTNFVHRERM